MTKFDEVQFIQELVSFYSPYGKEHEISKYLVAKMKKLGFDSYLDNAGNAIGKIGIGKKQILFAGHMDVFPGHLKVKIDKNKLYGRGSVDAKGCIGAFISASARLKDNFDKSIYIACCVEEEGPSSKGARALMKDNKLHPDFIIIGEPSGWDSLTVGYKGVISFSYLAHAQSSHYGRELQRPVDKIIAFLNELKIYLDSLKADSFFDSPSLEIRSINSNNNGIDETCFISIAIRIPIDFDILSLNHFINDQLQSKVVFDQAEPCVYNAVNNDLFKIFRNTIIKFGGKAMPKKKYGTSDMNILVPYYSVPCLAYGPGDSKLDHTPEEHLDLEEYQKSIAVLEDVLTRI